MPPEAAQLLRLGRGEHAATLFLIHPVGGSAFCYARLASLLDDTFLCYGVQARGMDAEEAIWPGSVAALAEAYLNQLAPFFKGGPVVLGGWSMGGLIAAEMAALLESRGGILPRLVMIDTATRLDLDYIGDGYHQTFLEHFLRDLAGLGTSSSGVAFGEVTEAALPAALVQLQKEAVRRGAPLGSVSATALARYYQVFRANLLRELAHTPTRAPIDSTLIRAEHQAPEFPASTDYGWNDYHQAVAVHSLPGTHYSLMGPPQVTEIAKVLRELARQGQTELAG